MRRIFSDEKTDEAFRRYGYVVRPLMTADEVGRMLAFFEETSTPALAGFHGTMYHGDAEYRRRIDAVLRPTVQEAILRVLVDYRPCTCNFMVKEPVDEGSELPLHQDWSFVREPEERSVHVWCPLVDVDHENGNLAVVPGSHHLSDPIRAFADDCPFREQFDRIREKYLLELPMKAGEAVFFDGRLVHSSPPNRSGRRRITMQAITVPKESTLHHGWRISPTQVELFQVDDEFFFDYVLHQPPKGAPSAGVVDYTVRQLTAEEVDSLAPFLEGAPLAAC
jgi:hypothetical protein